MIGSNRPVNRFSSEIRRRSVRRRPASQTEVLEGRTLLAVGFSELPIRVEGSFVTAPDGSFWFTQGAGNLVQKIAPSGALSTYSVTSGFAADKIINGPSGDLWVAETGPNPSPQDPSRSGIQIGRITPSGAITEFAIPADPNPQISDQAVALTSGPGGNIWVEVSRENLSSGTVYPDQLAEMTPSGKVTQFSVPNLKYGFGSTIIGGPDGNLWYTEPSTSSIGLVSPSGNVVQFPLPGGAAKDLVSGPDGNVWYTEASGAAVGRITRLGAATLFATPGMTTVSSGQITVGPDGNLWATEEYGVARITTSGVVSEYITPEAYEPPQLIGVGPQGALLYTHGTLSSGTQLGVIATKSTASTPIAAAVSGTTVIGQSFAVEVAHFVGTDPNATAADYQAVVHWDGPAQLGNYQATILPDGSGGYGVYLTSVGSPGPITPSPETLTVTIDDERNNSAAMTSVTTTLVEQAAANGTIPDLYPTVTVNAQGNATATASTDFIGGAYPANAYTATISLGDGSPTVSIPVSESIQKIRTANGGLESAEVYAVSTTHHYAKVGGYKVTVTFINQSKYALSNLANDVLATYVD